MPNEVRSLRDFMLTMIELLDMLDRCQEVLFRASFRRHLASVLHDAMKRIEELSGREEIRSPEGFESMYLAGLTGDHLAIKLDSFESSLLSFRDTASDDRLEEVLSKGSTILGSLAGAIPGFGSFAQELIDFLLKELRRRLFGRRYR
ncbi:hypothetical protein GCM10007862_28850 [Dyella lipolytica]|uniref:Uncharacterized protein n=1 Tax=Dyella lipolytica TaxID=1867835 RepID=A0ABW8IVE1_9GAMM|nr:hypothetical protein [Dyella lipolytica]GLQ47834.1 hypothetical protein GCM10007862_28850 [Dyella lipolytica]